MTQAQKPPDAHDTHLSHSIVKSSADAIISKDLDGIITFWNPAAAELFGYSAKEAIGHNISLIIPADRMDEEKAIVERLRAGEKAQYIETTRTTKDGRLVDLSISASHLYDSGRGMIGVSEIVRDITDTTIALRKAEETLKQKEAFEKQLSKQASFLKSILDHLPVSVFAKDVKQGYRWILWNKAAAEQFKLSAEAVMGRVDYDLFPKSEAAFFRRTDERVMAGRKVVDIPVEPITSIDKTWLAHTTKVPIYDENGEPHILLGICEDITERKKAEDNLRNYEAIVKYSDDAVLITTPVIDEPGPQIIYVNEAFTKITGYKAEEVVGKSPRLLQGPKTDREVLRKIRKYLRNNVPFVEEIINYHKDGSEYWLSLSVFPIPDESGKTKYFAAIERDITDAKKKEGALRRSAELEIQKEQAEKANQAKSDFLANMSHELRTPLNSIIGMTRLLEDSTLPDEQLDMIGVVAKASSHLLDLVNDILDLSKIEANTITLESVGIDLVSIINRTIDTLIPLAQKKNISLSYNYNTRNISFVLGDPTRLTSIFTNLVGNAIKYTDKGSVKVDVNFEQPSQEILILSVGVIDTGIGIAEENLDKVFDKFTQVTSTDKNKYGGTGLGLTITKKLVELMNGHIKVESKLGEGSIFSIQIPFSVTNTLQKSSAETKLEAQSYQTCGVIPLLEARVLVAEDHKLNQVFITKLLGRFGIPNVTIVEDGEAALQALQQRKFDIVLMDCQMPVKNGYETAKAIRSYETGTLDHIPIVAMTANAMAGDKEKCLTAGMDEYMSKPLDADLLKKILGKWLKFSPSHSEASPAVDLQNIRSYSGGNKDEERHYVRLFLQQNLEVLTILKANCVDGLNMEWSEAAHLMKSGAASIGAKPLRALCEEAQAMKSGSAEQRRGQLRDIEIELERIRLFLVGEGLI